MATPQAIEGEPQEPQRSIEELTSSARKRLTTRGMPRVTGRAGEFGGELSIDELELMRELNHSFDTYEIVTGDSHSGQSRVTVPDGTILV
jgi:hypothetical protein